MVSKKSVKRGLITGLIGISIYSLGMHPAQAAPSPHTPVSSDPSYKAETSVTYDPNIKSDQYGLYSKAFTGTGKVNETKEKAEKKSPAKAPYSIKSVIGSDDRTRVTRDNCYHQRLPRR